MVKVAAVKVNSYNYNYEDVEKGICICQLKSVPPSQLKSVPLYAKRITELTRLLFLSSEMSCHSC